MSFLDRIFGRGPARSVVFPGPPARVVPLEEARGPQGPLLSAFKQVRGGMRFTMRKCESCKREFVCAEPCDAKVCRECMPSREAQP